MPTIETFLDLKEIIKMSILWLHTVAMPIKITKHVDLKKKKQLLVAVNLECLLPVTHLSG